jgi:hypothetical protein
VRTRLALALLVLLVPPAHAAEPDPDPLEPPPASDLFDDEFSALELFRTFGMLRPRVQLGHSVVVDQPYRRANVDSFGLKLQTSVAAPVTESVALRVGGYMESTLFHFEGDDDFLRTGRSSGDPFDELLSQGFSLEGRYTFLSDWAAVGRLAYDSSWERGARYADGTDLSALLGVAYNFRRRLSIVAGVRAGSLLDGSPSFSPAFRVGWRVTDEIEIETQELGLQIAARLSPEVTIYLMGRRASESYSLENRGGSIGKAELRERSVPILFGARWKITKRWRLRGHLGALAYQKYVVQDDEGDTLDKVRSTGPAFTFQAQLEYRF